MNPNFKEYLDLLVPKNLPQKRRNELFNELETHLFDKAQYYEKIGYSKDESLELAVRDMGTDKGTVREINVEFESLYRERTWQAIIAGALVLLFNGLCGHFGQFVVSADYLGAPVFLMNCVSFGLVFVMLFVIVAARGLKFRKMLAAVGVADFIVGASLLFCFFPQAALFSIETDIMYFIDRFSPFSMWSEIYDGAHFFYPFGCMIFLFSCTGYCLVSARKIKNGTDKRTAPFSKRLIVFCAVYLLVAVFTCALYLSAFKHMEYDIPTYIDPYNSYISPKSETAYEAVLKAENYDEASAVLSEIGAVNTEKFKETLNYSQKKALSKQMKLLKLEDETFDVWFFGKECPDGNGLIFLKNDGNGKIAACGVGNGSRFLEKGKYSEYNFFFSNAKNCEGEKSIKYFRALKKGADEKSVIAFFKSNNTCFCSDFSFFESSGERRVYRMYQQQKEGEKFTEMNIELYTELVFENGRLSSGSMLENSEQWFSSANVVRTSNTFKIEQ